MLEEILPILGVNVPDKRLKNTTGLHPEYIKFAQSLQEYLDQLVNIDDLMDTPTDVVQAEYQATTNFKHGLFINFDSFFDSMHNIYFE